MDDWQLKRLSADNLESAMAKAKHYRDLNQPEEAESICRDVLDVDALHSSALMVLGLALTDQFSSHRVGLFEEAMAVFAKLESQYERVYHQGVAWERIAKVHLAKGEGHGGLTSLEHALDLYEKAEKIAPPNTPDSILRWNRCVRLLSSHPILRDAMRSPHSLLPVLGD